MATLDNSQKQPKKRHLVWGLVLVIVALAFTWRIVSVTHPSQSPFSDEDKVLDSVPWMLSNDDGTTTVDAPYTWFDNDTVLYARRDKNDHYQIMRQQVRGRHLTPAEPIPNIKPLTMLRDLCVSPDRKWLLLSAEGANSNDYYFVYALDGSGQKQRYDFDHFGAIWMADGKSFVESFGTQGELLQHGIDKKERTQLKVSQQLIGYNVLSPQGEYFVSEYDSSPTPAMKMERGSIFGGKSQVWIVQSPQATKESNIDSVSPQGDRLLWGRLWNETSWLTKLTGWVMQQGIDSDVHQQWYVTDTKGKTLQIAATTYTSGVRPYNSPLNTIYPQWLPDGKHLSVVYNGALYVIPVP